MASVHKPAALPKYLRHLREHAFGGASLTQEKLATAFSTEQRISAATLSSWESLTTDKMPNEARLNAYARFFATKRSLEPRPHLIPLEDLTEEERERFHEIEEAIRVTFESGEIEAPPARRELLDFTDPAPVVIICPEAPTDSRGPLADPRSPNFTRLHAFADTDALIEVFGHIRVQNPETEVRRHLPSTVRADELSNHVVILGGVGWNPTVRRILAELNTLPIKQIEDDRLKTGDVFVVQKDENHDDITYFPRMELIQQPPGRAGGPIDPPVEELVEDIGLLARLPNPFNSQRTVTIFNGIHSRGVVGAVLAVTDERVRRQNEEYLAQHYPDGDFAMLIRVAVIGGEALAPDISDAKVRIFEWDPSEQVPTKEGP